jgi:hypothetical protein
MLFLRYRERQSSMVPLILPMHFVPVHLRPTDKTGSKIQSPRECRQWIIASKADRLWIKVIERPMALPLLLALRESKAMDGELTGPRLATNHKVQLPN